MLDVLALHMFHAYGCPMTTVGWVNPKYRSDFCLTGTKCSRNGTECWKAWAMKEVNNVINTERAPELWEELKPCPLCGSHVEDWDRLQAENGTVYYAIECMTCRHKVEKGSATDCIIVWNHRPSP